MCFNKEYSFTYSIIGLVIIRIMQNNPDKFHSLSHLPVIFYTIMEITQTIQVVTPQLYLITIVTPTLTLPLIQLPLIGVVFQILLTLLFTIPINL